MQGAGKERSNNGIEERIQLPVLLWALAPKKWYISTKKNA
jgi:hypothetical protein